MTPVEGLRLSWALLTVLGLLGTAWHLWVWTRARGLARWGATQPLTWDDREAIRGRRRNATYRLAVKACLTAFAGACWLIFTGHAWVTGWGLVWVATVLFAAALGLLTVWSFHAWYVAMRRRGR